LLAREFIVFLISKGNDYCTFVSNVVHCVLNIEDVYSISSMALVIEDILIV